MTRRRRWTPREALRLIDAEPVLDGELLALGRWIAAYYCAPLGEVLRGMLPLAAEVRHGKVWSLTDSGRDAARQLLFDTAPDDPVIANPAHAGETPAFGGLSREDPAAGRQGVAFARTQAASSSPSRCRRRDPLRAPADRLRVELAAAPPEQARLSKPERELRAFLELHPGSHNLKELEEMIRNASPAARSLARQRDRLADARDRAAGGRTRADPACLESRAAGGLRADSRGHPRAAVPHVSAARRHRVGQDRGLSERHRDGASATGRSALLLVPEIALTPGRGGPVLLPLRRPRGHSAQRLHRRRSAPSSGGAFGRARLRWWSARAPASSRRCAIWA